MKKTIIFALALALLGGVAYANFGARDTVPAATLLVPYIIVDADAAGVPDTTGYTTLTVVTNVSSTKQLIHVTVYNAASEGVVDFDEVLTGYDVWTINWRDLVTGDFELFDTGKLPGGFWTGTVGKIGSPFGPTTNALTSFTGLNNPQDSDYTPPANTNCGFPWGDLTSYSGIIVTKLQSPLIGWPTQDTDCIAATTKDDIASPAFLANLTDMPLFFYATIDAVKACNGFFPDVDSNYWNDIVDDADGGSYAGYNSRHNVLTGYDFYLNNTLNYSESLPTVNIEASVFFESLGGFYYTERYHAFATNPYDDREPLPTAWAFNYYNTGGITTEVGVWKNVHELDFVDGLILACRPYIYYAWDEDEKSKSRTTIQCPSGLCFGNPEPNVFPFETQKVAVTQANFTGLMSGNGWIMLIFDPSIPYYPIGIDPDQSIQSYVFAKYNWGTYSTSVEATSLGTPFWNSTEILPGLNAYDGSFTVFE